MTVAPAGACARGTSASSPCRADSAFREELSVTAVDLKLGSLYAANWPTERHARPSSSHMSHLADTTSAIVIRHQKRLLRPGIAEETTAVIDACARERWGQPAPRRRPCRLECGSGRLLAGADDALPDPNSGAPPPPTVTLAAAADDLEQRAWLQRRNDRSAWPSDSSVIEVEQPRYGRCLRRM